MTYSSAFVNLIGLGRIQALIERLGEARRTRLVIRSLEEMSDYQLRDIGLSRDCLTAMTVKQSRKHRPDNNRQSR